MEIPSIRKRNFIVHFGHGFEKDLSDILDKNLRQTNMHEI
jgi:hypothetical protein